MKSHIMKSKWVTVFLIVSICINLALAGYIVGNRTLPGMGFDATRSYPRWVHTLPPERREVMWPLVRQQRKNMRPAMRALRKYHHALRTAIVNKPFSREGLDETLQAIREQHGHVQSLTHDGFIEFVAQLSDEEREQLASDMARRKRPNGNPHASHSSKTAATMEP